ncbi:hypothetical protein [Methanosarcina mazei]|jgi:hypothetical protein|uniref:hypothetical protein n=1 Tax=Methanosarcina mazei TaxID=2209 RepID=UPI00064FBA6C|nr:hypothetical protein [Methanosarcina mazei]
MCIIIDKNCFGSVFSTESADYTNFEPIKTWLKKGCNSKIVYGGTKYCEELRLATKYSKIFRLFKDKNRVVELNKDLVDRKQEEIELLVSSLIKQNIICEDNSRPRFDDPHIVSIAVVSKCKLVCTKDEGLQTFLKMNFLRKEGFFPRSDEIPLIYCNLSNKDLLRSQNVAEICKEPGKLGKVKEAN